MDYEIISFENETGQIQVSYLDNGQKIATYAIDVPIVDGMFITGESLENEIQLRAPLWLQERKEQVKMALNASALSSLVTTSATVSNEVTPNMGAEIFFEQQVAKALVKFKVLQEDPTTIPVATL
jgi:hypothetical protein